MRRTFEEDEDGTLLEYPPKNGKARTVPLPQVACEELAACLTAQPGTRKFWDCGLLVPIAAE